jgi:hypothetical protein
VLSCRRSSAWRCIASRFTLSSITIVLPVLPLVLFLFTPTATAIASTTSTFLTYSFTLPTALVWFLGLGRSVSLCFWGCFASSIYSILFYILW